MLPGKAQRPLARGEQAEVPGRVDETPEELERFGAEGIAGVEHNKCLG